MLLLACQPTMRTPLIINLPGWFRPQSVVQLGHSHSWCHGKQTPSWFVHARCVQHRAVVCVHVSVPAVQVCSAVHVYGHSHRCANVTLDYTVPASPATAPSTAAAAAALAAGRQGGGTMQQQQQQQSTGCCRYVQYAVDAVGDEAAGLYCLWDGDSLTSPGCIVPVC